MFEEVEHVVGEWVGLVGIGFDVLGVVVILVGILWSTVVFVRYRAAEPYYRPYKQRIGRSLLLGLEILVAADIVKTIAIEPTFESLGVLASLVVVRTFLSWTLSLEVEGRWPWQAERREEEA